MNSLRIIPSLKDYIWGGEKLKNYGIDIKNSNVAEAWILSFNDNGPSFLDNGKTLKEGLTKKDLGEKYYNFPFFPYLIKLIDANDKLSIQVHPSDEYALKNENSFGKTEMWYVLEAEKDAFLYLGLKDDCEPEQIEKAIKENKICDLLNKVPVKPGDCYFVESGTIHAIGKGIVILEIQQNSALTYRVYDYDRVDKFGNHRELHIEKALKVINCNKFVPMNKKSNPLGECEYFYVNKVKNIKEIKASKNAGITISFIDGSGKIDNQPFKKGSTFFIRANSISKIEGNYEAITTTIK